VQQIEETVSALPNVGTYIYTTLAFLALLGAPYIYEISSLSVKAHKLLHRVRFAIKQFVVYSATWKFETFPLVSPGFNREAFCFASPHKKIHMEQKTETSTRQIHGCSTYQKMVVIRDCKVIAEV